LLKRLVFKYSTQTDRVPVPFAYASRVGECCIGVNGWL